MRPLPLAFVTSAVFSGIGPTELLIVLGLVLLILGPKRLPQLGRQLGGGMREFRDSIRGHTGEDDPVSQPLPLAEPARSDRPGAAAAGGEVVSERH